LSLSAKTLSLSGWRCLLSRVKLKELCFRFEAD